jgi:hypothetical protein
MPVVVGFVSPVPGGTALGVLVAPFTALAGAAYGGFAGVSGGHMDRAGEELLRIESELIGEQLGARLREELLRAGAGTGLRWELVDPAQVPEPGGTRAYNGLGLAPLDAVLEVHVERIGLTGRWSVDPPIRSFADVTARVYLVPSGELVFDERVRCGSEVTKPYVEWAKENGAAFQAEFSASIPELAEKIVEDLFLFYPLP